MAPLQFEWLSLLKTIGPSEVGKQKLPDEAAQCLLWCWAAADSVGTIYETFNSFSQHILAVLQFQVDSKLRFRIKEFCLQEYFIFRVNGLTKCPGSPSALTLLTNTVGDLPIWGSLTGLRIMESSLQQNYTGIPPSQLRGQRGESRKKAHIRNW